MINELFVKGYATCIEDIEKAISQVDKNTSTIKLLNSYCLALYLVKLNLKEMQEEQEDNNTTNKITKFIKIITSY